MRATPPIVTDGTTDPSLWDYRGPLICNFQQVVSRASLTPDMRHDLHFTIFYTFEWKTVGMLNDVQSMHITISYIIYTIHLNHDGYIYKYTYGTRFCIYVWLLVSVFKTAYDIWIFNQVTISARAFQPNRQGGSHEKQPALRKVAEAGLQSHNGRQLQSHVGKGRKMLIPTLPVPVTAKY